MKNHYPTICSTILALYDHATTRPDELDMILLEEAYVMAKKMNNKLEFNARGDMNPPPVAQTSIDQWLSEIRSHKVH